MARILSSRIIHEHPGRHVARPTIGKTASGQLLVSFSGDRAGQTWGEPDLVNDTPLDDRDAGLCVGPDGTLVISWFTTWRNPEDPTRRLPCT